MDQAQAQKMCVECGADVTGHRYHKNRRGDYVCLPCHRAAHESADSAPGGEPLKRCVFCDAEVPRRECHKNRYGEYVCLKCRQSGRRWTWQRTVLREFRHRFLYVARYLAITALVLWVAYKILGKIIERTY